MGLLLHNTLSGIQGGSEILDERYHLTAAELANLGILVGGGDTALHFHSADRDRANHTGTQLLATISDAGSMAAQDADDYLLLTGGILTGPLSIVGSSDEVQSVVQANATQTENLREFRKSDGTTVLSGVDERGIPFADGAAGITNSFYGTGAGNTLAVTSGNTAIGYQTLNSTTNNNNTALGYFGLRANTSGTGNTAVGFQTLRVNSIGDNNTAFGVNSQRLRTAGDNNTAIGASTLFSNVIGDGNVAFGFSAGFNELGSNTLYIANSNTTTPLIYGLFTGTDAGITIHSQNVAGVPLIVKAIASQTANLQEWQNSSSATQLAVASNGRDFILDTVTGTMWGTATGQKQAFWGATPIVRPTGVGVDAASIHAALVNLGLIAA
ncbi:hypothetical protein KAR91_80200 [Candidatus Pacearchaeota archaeon]|nr:hypothetical protein [Candidatus Pacearchaeota archaeon]